MGALDAAPLMQYVCCCFVLCNVLRLDVIINNSAIIVSTACSHYSCFVNSWCKTLLAIAIVFLTIGAWCLKEYFMPKWIKYVTYWCHFNPIFISDFSETQQEMQVECPSSCFLYVSGCWFIMPSSKKHHKVFQVVHVFCTVYSCPVYKSYFIQFLNVNLQPELNVMRCKAGLLSLTKSKIIKNVFIAWNNINITWK